MYEGELYVLFICDAAYLLLLLSVAKREWLYDICYTNAVDLTYMRMHTHKALKFLTQSLNWNHLAENINTSPAVTRKQLLTVCLIIKVLLDTLKNSHKDKKKLLSWQHLFSEVWTLYFEQFPVNFNCLKTITRGKNKIE